MSLEIADLKDNVSGVSFKEAVEKLALMVDVADSRRFFRFYLACPEDKLEPLVDYLREGVGVSRAALLETELLDGYRDILPNLRDMLDQISAINESRLLVVSRGFEKIVEGVDYHIFTRAGHDYDQNIAESSHLKEAVQLAGKKIVVATHIGYSRGEESYQRAVKTALMSQFKDGLFEAS